PSLPLGSAYWPTCAIPCTTHQPNSTNRTHHRTPKPESHQPNPSPSHNITRSGIYIKPNLHRKWDATLTELFDVFSSITRRGRSLTKARCQRYWSTLLT